MKLKLTWLLTLFMAFVMQFSFAQEKTVTGTVTTASDGLPLPGATVVVKGTARGTQTDFDGKYTIQAKVGDVLVISYVAMDATEVTVGASNVYDVALSENALEEVVVVGYGTTTKKAFAGTVTTVDAENIEDKNFANVTQSLAGEASGVQVINTTGQPGTVSAVRIRGFGSISGNRSPLYVVDGVPITATETLNAINPTDIKSTVILKDATATAIYGSRGSNGVVLITTKSGSSAESYIEVDVKTGVNAQLIPRYELIRNQEENIELIWEGARNQQMLLNGLSMDEANAFASANLFSDAPTGIIPVRYNMWNAPGDQLIDPATGQFTGVSRKFTPTNFQDLLIREGERYEANVRFGGGNDKTRYFVSGGFLDDNGIIRNSSYKRYTVRTNISSQVKDWLKVGANVSYLYAESRNSTTLGGASAVFEFIDKTPTLFGVYARDNDGNLIPDERLGGFVPDYGAITFGGAVPGRPASDGVSPFGNMLYDFNGSDRNEFLGNFNLDFTIAEGLTFENAFSYQYRGNIGKTMSNQFYGPGLSAGGTLGQTNSTFETLNLLQLVRYRKDFGKHSIEALAAHEINDQSFQFIFANKEKAVVPFALELSQYIINQSLPGGYEEGRSLESYFAQVNYDFDDKYYLTGSIRRDGSSVFSDPDNKWDTFWSVGGAWIMSNEDFLADNDFIRYLKLKGSVGLAGDEAGVVAAQGYYSGVDQFSVDNLDGAFSVSLLGDRQNPDLTWERKKQLQFGTEFTLGDFLDGSIDWYRNDTENLFFNIPVSPSTGSANLLVNDGELRNTGLEFDLNFHIFNKENFKLDVAVNGAHYQNELLELFDGAPNDFVNFGTRGLEVGRSIFDFYMREYAGVDPADGFPMWYQYYDDLNDNGALDPGEELVNNSFLDGEGNEQGIPDHTLTPYLNANGSTANIRKQVTKNFNEATQRYTGKSVIPDLQGAFRLQGSIHNFTYAAQFTYQFGGYAYDNNYREFFERGFNTASGSLHADIRDRWQQPGDITNVPLLGNGSVPQDVGESDRFIISSDYFALNSLNIGYNLPSKFLDKTGIDNVNLFLSGDNLFLFSSRQGYDPRVREGGFTARNIYAPLSSFTVGLRMKF
ncbi:SusC/RagA family TonB-linked outer membrane protein [Winogradskyella alexanderae]|uniref:SusC/RagA family TonB-linked outer membrane protein n=1 Tax=Winogradskyella alexanderae TaxID=2877123 RepID=A0ABS7XT84_9FLAO|nr:SusC/RagA family TonB-linked outer membrane protein [Winogradskyella alexanderae]MCA0133246.1 SusC/RagA family TonB-linked outer membrane protein [Winogradskyella alexanderae]